MRFRGQARSRWTGAVIDLTPLIDIVFLLLLFFLLTAAPAPDPTLDVALPSASSAQVRPESREVTVILQSTGALFFEGVQVSLPELELRLLKLAGEAPETKVVFRGDRASRYDLFVAVLEAASAANLTLNVAVTESPAGIRP